MGDNKSTSKKSPKSFEDILRGLAAISGLESDDVVNATILASVHISEATSYTTDKLAELNKEAMEKFPGAMAYEISTLTYVIWLATKMGVDEDAIKSLKKLVMAFIKHAVSTAAISEKERLGETGEGENPTE